ncbi:DUF2189 domain-containing protein [Aquabacterium sp.]|uniref:DUF2189 domain-containing protein n=1 Tax=Aquabacterium sp. TaxID=1872578 RepID=UPI002E2F7F91|nr:DUF2189 domain-containing protein [Aquabacterium sp.]HEX5310369.1 DUF2189 domain-containing protein [Aquabacterium sp.]
MPHPPVQVSAPVAPEPALDPLGGLQAHTHPPSALDWPLAPVRFGDPLRWLAAGWRDFQSAPLIGLFYGACFVGMGWLLLAVFKAAPEYTLALSAGFLLLGPFLCLGLYQVSRDLGQGVRPNFVRSLMAWRSATGQISIFAGVLLVLEMLWGRAAMIVFAISFDGVPHWDGTVSDLLHGDNLTFLITYSAVGAVFAGLIYAVSVISMPLMMDRAVDAVTAGLTSMRLVLTQTPVMVWWGVLISALVLLAMLPGFVGLIVVGPVLGHASWHAYRQVLSLVDAGQ